jgi:hypothetical protein
MQDFHAFVGACDTVAAHGLTVGRSELSKDLNIPLEHGTFHNAPMLTTYHTYRMHDGVPEGDFSSVVMGNTYDMAAAAPRVDTNYAYSFTTALATKYAGLPLRGTMTETVYTTDTSSGAVTIRQRIVSIRLIR